MCVVSVFLVPGQWLDEPQHLINTLPIHLFHDHPQLKKLINASTHPSKLTHVASTKVYTHDNPPFLPSIHSISLRAKPPVVRDVGQLTLISEEHPIKAEAISITLTMVCPSYPTLPLVSETQQIYPGSERTTHPTHNHVHQHHHFNSTPHTPIHTSNPPSPTSIPTISHPKPRSNISKKSVRFAQGPPDVRYIPPGMTDWADGETWKRPCAGRDGVELARKALEKAQAEEEEDYEMLEEAESMRTKRRAALVVVGTWVGVRVVRAVLEMWV